MPTELSAAAHGDTSSFLLLATGNTDSQTLQISGNILTTDSGNDLTRFTRSQYQLSIYFSLDQRTRFNLSGSMLAAGEVDQYTSWVQLENKGTDQNVYLEQQTAIEEPLDIILGEGDYGQTMGILEPGSYGLEVFGWHNYWDQTSSATTSVNLELTTVPLPAAAWFFMSALIGLIAIPRKRIGH